jgi:hypothetical protein
MLEVPFAEDNNMVKAIPPYRREVRRIGHVIAVPILGGSHHQYVR